MSALPADNRDMRGPRWSTAVRCPRAAVYQAQEVPAAPPSERMQGFFLRGDVFGEYAKEMVREFYRLQGIEVRAEPEVPWPPEDPVGKGHADITVPAESKVTEVYTNGNLTVFHHKVLQGAGYALGLGYDNLEVMVIDPNTSQYIVRDIPLEAHVEEVRARWDAVYAGVVFGELPERVCDTPHSPEAFFCSFVEHCFEGWEPPPVLKLKQAEELRTVVQVRNALKEARAEVARLEEQERAARAELAIAPGEWHELDGIQVKRAIEPGRHTLPLSEMEAAGVTLPDYVEAWIKQGKPFEKWYLREAK